MKYNVTAEVSSLSHGPDVFPVVDGVVDLPENQTWYHDLLDCGVLVPPDVAPAIEEKKAAAGPKKKAAA